jgi:hypothetical protein
MRKVICLLFLSALTTPVEVLAREYKEIYPFKPIPSEDIVTKTKYLSEDPEALTNIFEIEKLGLSRGETVNRPWSGPYWSLKQGMIANPYMDRGVFQYVHYIPTFDAIEPYLDRKNYIMTTEAQLSEKELAKLAPSEKYDLLLGNGLDLSHRIWRFINTWKDDMKWDYMTSIELPGENFVVEKENYIVANWEGICHGWAPASGVVPKPEKTVTVTLPDGRIMPFYPEDIKGLISLTWANSLVQDNVLSEGLRCKRRFPKSDRYGRYYDTIEEDGEILPRCADIHPAVMHLSLVNLTGKQGRSFIIDKAEKIAVSNQPVTSYKFKYFHPDTGRNGKFEKSLVEYRKYRRNDPFSESRHPDTKYIIGVESTIVYADWTMIKKPGDKDYLKDKTSDLVSLYDLEIDGAGNIIGGQWRGIKDLAEADDHFSDRKPHLNQSRPDFLWVVPKNYKSYFKPVAGLEEWDITSGGAAPESWKEASITAHSFIYEMSERYGTADRCKVKDRKTGEVKRVKCEFKYPRPQPLIQVVDQLIELSSQK